MIMMMMMMMMMMIVMVVVGMEFIVLVGLLGELQ